MDDDTPVDQSNFDAFLAWLNPDREEAGKIYEQIRRRLIKFFECRRCLNAEELADDTIIRVTSKIPKIAKDYVGERALYFYGVAYNVFRESIRRPHPVVLPPPIETSEDFEKELECLDHCVLKLTAGSRELVIEYYQNDKKEKIQHRKALAEKLGVAQNALRIRAHRIRLTLQQCVRTCIEQGHAG